MIHTVKGFSVANEAEVNVFLEHSCFFYDSTDVGNLIFCSSAFSKSSLNICKCSVHILLKPSLENFQDYFASVWDECKCAVVWTFFGIAFLWDWNENWPFPVLGPSSFKIWNSSIGIQSPPLALFVTMLPKGGSTLHSMMSGSGWIIPPFTKIWVMKIFFI